MAIAAAARSFCRSSSVRSAASRLASQPKPAPSPFRLPSKTRSPLAHRVFRSPAEMSACLASLQPYHTATASALMTSMLTVSRFGFGWLPEGFPIESKVLSATEVPCLSCWRRILQYMIARKGMMTDKSVGSEKLYSLIPVCSVSLPAS